MLFASVGHLVGPEVDLVAYEGNSTYYEEEEDEREEVGEAGHCQFVVSLMMGHVKCVRR